MSEQQHTSGPWMVHPYVTDCGPHNKALDVGPEGRAVCTVIGAFERPSPGPEAEANARLIAAAPELLEALRAARADTARAAEAQFTDGRPMNQRAVDRLALIDAAIAKVTGR